MARQSPRQIDMDFEVLLIDDNAAERALAHHELQLAYPEMVIREVTHPAALQEHLQRSAFDLVITAYQLGWSNGLEILQTIKAQDVLLPVIMLAGAGSEEVAEEAMKYGLDDYIIKTGESTGRLAAAVKKALETAHHQKAAAEAQDRYRSLFNSVPIGLFWLSPEDALLDLNPAFVRSLGFSAHHQLAGKNFGEFFAREEDRQTWAASRARSGQIEDFEAQLRKADGALIWVWISGRSMARADNQNGLFFEGSLIDVTARIEATRSLRLYADRLSILREIDQAILGSRAPEEIARATLHHIQQLIPSDRGTVAIFDLQANQMSVFATYGNQQARLGTGALLSPQTFGDLASLKRGEPVLIQDTGALTDPAPWALSIMAEGIQSYLKVPLMSGGKLIGSLNLESERAYAFAAEHIEAASVVADSLAIAIQQAQLSEQVHLLAITDGLTGLYNRRHFFELGGQEFKRAKRYRRTLAAIMLDIDRFKRVNDTHGHATGDEVLQTVAARCQRTLRDIDILGRYGGEEFAILLPETDLEAGERVAERLRRTIGEDPIKTRGQILSVTISLGVAQLLPETASLAELLDCADAGMYRAKQAGRNRVRTY